MPMWHSVLFTTPFPHKEILVGIYQKNSLICINQPHEGSLTQFKYEEKSRYHKRAQLIVRPEEEVKKATANRPFADLIDLAKAAIEEEPTNIETAITDKVESWLEDMFAMLTPEQLGVDISFSINEDDDLSEIDTFAEVIEANKLAGMDAMVNTTLPQKFSQFTEIRGIFRFMKKAGILTPFSIIPDSVLPWFTITTPVWYVAGKSANNFSPQESPDPYPDTFVKYICKRLGTQRLSYWYQIWNRRTRPNSLFNGDVMPLKLVKLSMQIQQILDFVVIATPYHDVASKEWADPNWQRLIDPYLLGFSKALPGFVFFLGRWSDTGIFPLASEMTAHTIAYLSTHKNGLHNFNRPYWCVKNGDYKIAEGVDIYRFATEALVAYNDNKLFEWLCEGRPKTKMLHNP